jgi:hypothetical protein
MARTIRVGPEEWDPGFRDTWQALLERAGSAVSAADAEQIRAVRADLTEFSSRLANDHLPSAPWPMFGALLVNLRNVLDALDAVAEVQPVHVRAPAIRA